ncbi:hypothetical protein [Vibrio marisflavi]|nr:hypothetical protein [Vibrio marisflavi]
MKTPLCLSGAADISVAKLTIFNDKAIRVLHSGRTQRKFVL